MSSREEKRIEIIQAAVNVFSEYGFDRAKMDYIAKEAGIGKGTIYEYFESKEDLFDKMIQYSIESFRIGLKKIMDQKKSIEEKLIKCSRYNAEFMDKHLDMIQMDMQCKVLSKEMRTRIFTEMAVIYEHYKDMVQQAKAQGELRADLDETLATYCIMGTIEQFIKHRIFLKRHSLMEVDHQAIVNVILKGLL